MLIVDTDILIDVQRGYEPAVDWFSRYSVNIAITGFSVMELIKDARNVREVQQARKFTAPIPVSWPTPADCDYAIELFATHHLSSKIGLIDALIAATALGRGAELATFNVKHFRQISGLTLVQPYHKN